MPSYLRQFLQSMVRKFRVLYEWARKFFVHSTPMQSGSKKFQIIRETPTNPEGVTNDGRSPRVRRGGITVFSQTRPQQCPICRTSENSRPGNIFRESDQNWGCKACGHRWRG